MVSESAVGIFAVSALLLPHIEGEPCIREGLRLHQVELDGFLDHISADGLENQQGNHRKHDLDYGSCGWKIVTTVWNKFFCLLSSIVSRFQV